MTLSATDFIVGSLGQGMELLAQEYGEENVPGWVFFLAVIVAIGGLLSTRKSTRTRFKILSELDTRLKSGPTTTSVYFEKDGVTVRQEAWLGLQGDWYALLVEEQSVGEAEAQWEIVLSVEFRSLDEMARYLAKHTRFTISDF